MDFLEGLARSGGRGGTRGVVRFGGGDDFAHAACRAGAEGFLHGLREGHRLRVGCDHPAPGERLHQVPVAAGGEKPRAQREDEGEFVAHESGGNGAKRIWQEQRAARGKDRSAVGSPRHHFLMRLKAGLQGAKDSSSGVWSFLSGPALVIVMRVALSAWKKKGVPQRSVSSPSRLIAGWSGGMSARRS